MFSGACEGLGAATMCVRYPNAGKSLSVQRNSSLQEGSQIKTRLKF